MADEVMSLERFAHVLAHQQHFGDAHGEEVRRRLEVEESAWSRSHDHWMQALYADTSGDQPNVAIRFAKRYAQVSATLSEERPTLESLGATPPPSSTVADSSSEEPSITDAPVPPRRIGDAQIVVAPPAPQTKGANRSPWLEAHREPSPVRPPPVAVPPSPVGPTEADGHNLDRTTLASGPHGEALPFLPSTFTDAKARLADHVAQGTLMGGMTGEIPAILSDGNETLPFLDASSLHLDDDIRSKFSVEQYASLCAELTVDPASRAHTLVRYGIDATSLVALREKWDRHLEDTPDDRATFDELFVRFRIWLSKNR